ncbi:MAG TPA: peptide-methionine (R)-S-oxide reductase MsrB [Chthonomonadaceae bacterium]|nr:peptide-methionine (R)-S-oxide reductase MsrB [Chthonomonadaceae bacterium]
MKSTGLLVTLCIVGVLAACAVGKWYGPQGSAPHSRSFAVVKTEAQWRRLLTPEQYEVMRQKGTEAAFTGKYDHFYQKGIYRCAACGNDLFNSDTKFNSGTGWPSFWAPLSRHSVRTQPDYSDGMERTEVLCDRCGAHLGHVFDDGPKPTGLRYCMNSVALSFISQAQLRQEAKKHSSTAHSQGAHTK